MHRLAWLVCIMAMLFVSIQTAAEEKALSVDPAIVQYLKEHPEKNQDPSQWIKIRFIAEEGYAKKIAKKLGDMDPELREILQLKEKALFVCEIIEDANQYPHKVIDTVTLSEFPATRFYEREEVDVSVAPPYTLLWAAHPLHDRYDQPIFVCIDPRKKLSPKPTSPPDKPGHESPTQSTT